jgi:hypothetical protein
MAQPLIVELVEDGDIGTRLLPIAGGDSISRSCLA